MGENAYYYLREREKEDFGSSDMRLERQKQYLKAFIKQAKIAIKDDVGVVKNLYNDIKPYMVTDITLDELMYIIPQISGYSFENDNMRMIQGETVMGEEFEEFYLDDEALYDMMIDVFYIDKDLVKQVWFKLVIFRGDRLMNDYSVLMAVYKNDNCEYLIQAIDSMLTQTVKPEQIVVVIDGPIGKLLRDTIFGYRIQISIIEHYEFSSSNFFMNATKASTPS